MLPAHVYLDHEQGPLLAVEPRAEFAPLFAMVAATGHAQVRLLAPGEAWEWSRGDPHRS